MLMDPHPSHQHAVLPRAVFRQQKEVTRPKARFQPLLHPRSMWWMGEHLILSLKSSLESSLPKDLYISSDLKKRTAFLSLCVRNALISVDLKLRPEINSMMLLHSQLGKRRFSQVPSNLFRFKFTCTTHHWNSQIYDRFNDVETIDISIAISSNT